MKQSLTQILMALFVATVAACAPGHGGSSNHKNAAPTSTPDGSSTGGGSFGNESSLTILRWASEDLAMQIRNSSPELYAKLPAGWSRERLADVIANVEPTKADLEKYRIPEVNRYGERLMFNYDKKADGTPYITATRLFTDAYASYEVNSRPKQDFNYVIAEVKLKLAHEAAHLMGLGLSKDSDMPEARTFAKNLIASLDSDNFECMPTAHLPLAAYSAHVAGMYNDQNLPPNFDQWTTAYVFNRPTGKAAVPIAVGAAPCSNAKKADDTPDWSKGYGQCLVTSHALDSSGIIYTFLPNMDSEFTVPTIHDAIFTAQRSYGYPQGYFSWNAVDLRKAVLTDNGYHSDYKYEGESNENDHFSDYEDFKINDSTAKSLVMESFPMLQQENWELYRSQGKEQIAIAFDNGQIQSANLIILQALNRWQENKDPNDTHLVVPLKCVHSFKALDIPAAAH